MALNACELLGPRVWGLRFRDYCLGFRLKVWGLGFRGLGIRGLGITVQGLG